MEYNYKSEAVNATDSVMALRATVDAHSLPHLKASKAVRACIGADILDGELALQNLTIKLVAGAVGVSTTSVIAAQRLTPEQRQAVKNGRRPLRLPRIPVPVDPVKRLIEIVAEIGLDAALSALAESEEKVAA